MVVFFPINFQKHYTVTLIIPTPTEHHKGGGIKINSKGYILWFKANYVALGK